MGESATMTLAGAFPAQTRRDWQDLVAGVVNKSRAEDARLDGPAAEARLRTELAGGLTIDPLYLRPETDRPLGIPGTMPFTRGRALRDPLQPWDIRQFHDDPDAARTRAAVLNDLEHGVTSVWVHLGADGIAPGDLGEVLTDVRLDLAPVVVSSTDAQGAAADALLAHLRAHVAEGGDLVGGNLGLDPLGAAARTGDVADLTGLAGRVTGLADVPGVRAITVDSRIYRDAGGTAVDELALAVATGVAYLRALAEGGVPAPEAFGHIEFRLSATADQFLTIAALRALRRIWARVGELCAVPEAERGARTHAVTSLRMYTRDDPWVNVLRATLATFAASAGGADAITVLPYDTVAGLPEKFSRRLARNTQVVLADEANVARVTDPAGGSWYVETLTDDLARAAWAAFQEIEAAGGVAAGLADGSIAARIEESRAAAGRALATRADPITGVSMFPLTAEQDLARRPRAAVPSGGLAVHRDAEVFEGLRDRGAALPADARVVVAALGTRRDYGPREGFVLNVLAAGGVLALAVEGTGESIAGAIGEPVPRVVILASSPKGYAAHGAAAVAALRDTGVERIHLAGAAAELPDDERPGAGLDGTLAAGIDVVAYLDDLLTALGSAPREAVPATGGHA